MNNTLCDELIELRDALKAANTDGRTPVVASDASIEEIVRLMPQDKSELMYIKGLGKAFVENYGDQFMDVLSRQKVDVTRNMSDGVREVLQNLENRLVNINKRNRLLYMPTLRAKNAVDLMSDNDKTNQKLVDFVLRFNSQPITLCEINGGSNDEAMMKKLNYLHREAMRDRREIGENNLYIAYPFVIGKMNGEGFVVRAPLALFPVNLELTPFFARITMDTDKDILYNNNLILSNNKFSRRKEQLPDNVVEDINKEDFLQNTLAFYSDNGMDIALDSGIKPFSDYSKTFPKFKLGEFHLEENIVLGRFPMYSGALQKDFKDIMESDSINFLLNDLLENMDEVDFYSDSEQFGESLEPIKTSERDINYINDLNNSQENAIIAINNGDKLVVQGPPGTGKSQTITGIIADFVNKGKNILMVSQKKAALDVIYSRLGNISKYTVMMNDVKDKDNFYNQLYRIFNNDDESTYDNREFYRIADSIDKNISKMDAIADKMYYSAEYGVGMFKLYEENVDNAFKSSSAERIKLFYEFTPSKLNSLGYTNLKETRAYLSNSALIDQLKSYYDIVDNYAWLNDIRSDYSEIELNEFKREADEMIAASCVYRSKNFVARLFSNGAYKKKITRIMKNRFAAVRKETLRTFIDNPVRLGEGLKFYKEFYTLKAKYNELEEAQKLYFGTAYNLHKVTGESVEELIHKLLEFISFYYITDFEAKNRDVLADVGGFDIIVRDIAVMMGQKRELTRDKMRAVLISSCRNNILKSKRMSDMQRVIDGKRKWNVSRFMDKFKFELFKGVKVWLMTPEVVSEVLPLENGLFDLLIFDEASQIYIEKGIPSIARAKKVVIAGDHKQLRPSSLGSGRIEFDDEDYDDENYESIAALEEESLLDLARFKYPEILLNYHYRSKYEELIAFSNYAFYKGRLNISPNVFSPDRPPIDVVEIKDGIWEKQSNLKEAEATVKYIKKALTERTNDETIGVITFNAVQRDLIQDLIDAECAVDADFAAAYLKEAQRKDRGEDIGLFVKNIENVQGDERDIIIFSLAYAKNTAGKVVRNFGWLNQSGGENRLNVAISRAKKKIIILTSLSPNELKVDDLKNEGVKIFKKYLEYAFAVSGGNSAAAKEILRSFTSFNTRTYEYNDSFVLEVFDALTREGLNVERNVGIGGYKIDLAIKDANGKYLIGLECDSNLYALSHESRERDVHRQIYLESRGWKMRRIWSNFWWKDRRAEIAQIKSIISDK